MSENPSDTIWVVTDERTQNINARNRVAVKSEKLKQEMTQFLQTVGEMFSQADQQRSLLQLDEIEISVQIDGQGQVSLLGMGEAISQGAIKLKFKRSMLPQDATQNDVAALKKDALKAEAESNYELAHQLWLQANVAASGSDPDAVQAFTRLARLPEEQRETALPPHSDSNVKLSRADLIQESAQTEFDINLVLATVALLSEVGVDYSQLRDLLAARQWQEADVETARIMLKASKREKEGWLRIEDIDKFPCTDLHTIDRLWVRASSGRFGFSIQKRIWQEVGGYIPQEEENPSYQAFLARTGWQIEVDKIVINWQDFTFLNAPLGHLPCWGWACGGVFGWGVVEAWGSCLFSRAETCSV